MMKPKGLTDLEKVLIALFVLLSAACVGLVVVYFVAEPTLSQGSSGCGNTQQLSGSSGRFTSLNYPNNYDDNNNCMWEITVTDNQVIHLWFEEFSLEDTLLCSGDHVAIRDNLAMLGKYCGHAIPKSLVSVGNKLTIFFASNSKTTDKGFKAFYEAIDPARTSELAGAGGHLQGDNGELQTPGFPASLYANDALYQWKISVATDQRIRLTFLSFELEPASASGCNDFVEVYDGFLEGSSLLGRFCGTSVPSPLVSSGHSLVLRFSSDSDTAAKGFQARYTAYRGVPPTETPPTADSGCGSSALQNGRKGTISSKDYPNSYPANLLCSWNITVPEGWLLKLSFGGLAIDGSLGQCGADKLEVADNIESIGTYCGFSLPPVIISTSNKLFLKFSSDSSLSDFGFMAQWEAVHSEDIEEIQKCGGGYHGDLGVIKSPRWPDSYPANGLCLWSIEAPQGKTLTLSFTHFDMEDPGLITGKCLDSVTIYDDSKEDPIIYGPFCGSSFPPIITSRGKQLKIRFYSDLFTEGKGFRAYWTTDPLVTPPTEPPTAPNPWDDIPIDWPDQCGKPTIPPQITIPRIVNGYPAKPNSWPWQVSMQVWPASRNETVFFHTCGGTLIHKNWVLTAAHCFISYADELHRWQMCLGKHNLTFQEPTQQCFKVKGIYRHEKFAYPEIPTVEYDIALVRLDGEVTRNDYINFACLPPSGEVLHNTSCYATGWGDETGNSVAPKVAEALNQVPLPVIEYTTCKRVDYWWFQVKDSMICAGYEEPEELRSVCQGDSGGPFVCQSTADKSVWEVQGITSFGALGCAVNKKPSVFTRSSTYITWIEQQIKKYTYDVTTSGCGGAKDLNATEGSLTSMSYPSNYKNNASCVWYITAPAGKVVHLHFTHFSLEGSTGCTNDKVNISDGISNLGSHCGSQAPSDIVSFSNVLTVQFISNSKIVDSGFSATWTFVDPPAIPGISGCGGQFNGDQGEFQSPQWPNATYPNGHVCTWSITADPTKDLRIVFTHFELQVPDIANLCVDYVEVYDMMNITTLGKFCGFLLPPVIITPGNGAVIRFFSNRDTQHKGFRGYWTTDPNVFPTLPPKPYNPWDNITIDWPTSCGSPAITPKSLQVRIANGEEATPHSWPWQVSVQSSSLTILPFQHKCGGSLIHEEWIILAARCLTSSSNLNLWRVCVGKHNMSVTESSENCISIDAIFSHEDFTFSTTKDHSNDVALVHLKEKVNFTQAISPICLPRTDEILPPGELCYATGWGTTKGSLFPVYSKVLMQVPLPIIPYDTCSKPKHWWDQLRPSMICAGYTEPDQPKSACEGDTGGPLACNSTSAMKWEVHGIMSFSTSNCLADNKPPVFTRVSAYRDWIEDKIKRFTFENQGP
ncbi:ovochymase-2-like [Pleurodeles waltl]|uniref:ovochymase-2-like n=1 Tax=Pleurodeles waltl TaxID=8319 RepID=UPI0037097FC8